MQKAKVFRYRKAAISDDRRVLHFCYEIETEHITHGFQESIGLPAPLPPELPESFITSIMRDLHLIFGISYFKAFCPPAIELGPITLSPAQAGFWNTVYTSGLGEFYYRNKIDYRDLVHFPSTDGVQQSTSLSTTDRVLTGVSGGRDSLVTIELLKKHTIPVSGFFVTNSTVPPFIEQTIKQTSIETMIVKRQIDPKLIELNKQGHVYNGHIPVSIVYALIGVLLAGITGTRYVVVSNEQSSDIGNVEYLGSMVNHQWSKSSEFEHLFHTYVHSFITPDITYFSMLRPFNELQIAEKFVKYPQYFALFSSCNRNFRIYNTMPTLWCGECAKCAFVYALLAATLDRKTVEEIFHKNLFADPELVPMYRSLAGVADIKPFECVGTYEEVREAMKRVYNKHEHDEDPVMQMYTREIADKFHDTISASTDTSNIPALFKNII